MVGKVFIKTTCPICGRECHPGEYRLREDFGDYRLKTSLGGRMGTRTEDTTSLLNAIEVSEDARRVFERIRKITIGLFAILWTRGLATVDDLPHALKLVVRRADTIREELEGSKILRAEDYRKLLNEIEERGLLNVALVRQNEKLKREMNLLIMETG
ncbi:unnamed protein product [marine sediment metagenome]|uniref:Uncharacterized protein n=1 Tax=marine sediment metagenome TaxID=412755 RepID=X1M713_9ZZZZ